jgi:hypothetical protein
MARTPVNYDPRAERLQVTARPDRAIANSVQKVGQTPASVLAESLGVGAKLADQVQQHREAEEARRAQEWAASNTVDDVGRAVKDGSLLPSRSPIFLATVQHIHGNNVRHRIERQLADELTTGKAQFATEAELDAHIQQKRNEALQGASRFTLAGFDKEFDKGKQKLKDAWSQKTSAEQVDAANSEGLESMSTLISSMNRDGVPAADQAMNVKAAYEALRVQLHMTGPQAKQFLKDSLDIAAKHGNYELVEALGNEKLDNGMTVAALLKPAVVMNAYAQAEGVFQRNGRERVSQETSPFHLQAEAGELSGGAWQKAVEYYEANKRFLPPTWLVSLKNANDAAERQLTNEARAALIANAQALAEGVLDQWTLDRVRNREFGSSRWTVNDIPRLLDSKGQPVDVSPTELEKRAQKHLAAITEGMEPAQAFELYANNGVVAPHLRRQLETGFMAMGTWKSEADPQRRLELSQQAQESIDFFRLARALNPQYTQKLIGDDGTLRFYEDVQFLMEVGGYPSPTEAAQIVTAGSIQQGIRGSDLKKNQVDSAVEKIVDPGILSNIWNWDFGDGAGNSAEVKDMVRHKATLLLRSGRVADPKQAVEHAFNHFSKNLKRVNGRMYIDTHLPQGPSGSTEPPEKWFNRFADEHVSVLAKEYGADIGDANDARLVPVTSDTYVVMDRNNAPVYVPGTMRPFYVTKGDAQAWYDQRHQQDIAEANETSKGLHDGSLIKLPMIGPVERSNFQFGPKVNPHIVESQTRSGEAGLKRGEQRRGAIRQHGQGLQPLNEVGGNFIRN